MSKKRTLLPTPAELAFYRSKIERNSFIGKNQLAAVFAALDDAVAQLKQAETLLFMAETVFGPRTKPGPERGAAAYALMNAMRAAGYAVDPARE